MTFLNAIKVYGKNINDLNEDERELLMIDCSMSYVMLNFNPHELDDEMSDNMEELSKLRAKISLKCAGMSEVLCDILPPEEVISRIEQTDYSYDKFLKTNINYANLMVMLGGDLNICDN